MSDTFVPPAGAAAAANRALEWIKDGKAGDGFTSTGRTRAGQLSKREGLSRDTIMRMVSFFARHEVDKKAEGFNQGEKGFPSAGRVAWDAWGGDAGKSWAESVAAKLKKEKAMASDFATSYAEIIKFNKNDDGTITVYGKATSDDLDIDQQICDNEWLAKAMPEWFKSGGNIREQHSSIAAGVAQELETKDDGYYVTAHVVDPTSVKKVEAKVLKGFSIGIKGPRVVRDNKAANGRIVDGQIVEVSLVDRPANPTCQLVLAKAVGGDSTLTQVEEMIETDTSKSVALHYNFTNKSDKDHEAMKNALLESIVEMQKSVAGDKVKFDQASYDVARRGIAQLIISEAGEIAETDSDERDDIDTLLSALKHLFNFRDGEIDEDQEAGMPPMISLAAKGDDEGSAGCDCDGCAACQKDGGCDDKMCKGCTKMSAKSADIGKCLECGCHQVGNAHGLSQVVVTGATPTNEVANVSTATIITPEQNAGSIKSAEGEEVAAEEVVAEDKPAEEKADELVDAELPTPTEILDEKSVSAIIEKAVKSATDTVKAEIAEFEAATKAAEEKVMALESELVAAKSAAIAGGPKRTGRPVVTDTNELLLKAAEYRLKASATSDQILAKGYKALEKEYLAKAGTPDAE
jgi:hypothetical protein